HDGLGLLVKAGQTSDTAHHPSALTALTWPEAALAQLHELTSSADRIALLVGRSESEQPLAPLSRITESKGRRRAPSGARSLLAMDLAVGGRGGFDVVGSRHWLCC